MNQVAAQSTQCSAKFAIAGQRPIRCEHWDRTKVRRQRADFLDLHRRPNQKKFILVIEPPQRTNHIADVCAYAKLGHPPNVDGDPHRWHLTTEDDRENSGIMLSLPPAPLRADPHTAGTPRTAQAPAS